MLHYNVQFHDNHSCTDGYNDFVKKILNKVTANLERLNEECPGGSKCKAAGKSQRLHIEYPGGWTIFESVKLDEEAIKGQKMFRLAESVNAVVVHRSIKEYLELKGGFELTFTEPEKWVG